MANDVKTGRLPNWMKRRMNDNQRFLVLCIIIGLCCGVAAVLFHWAIHFLFHSLWNLSVELGGWQSYALLIGAPGFAGLIVGVGVQYFSPDSVGSGIPQTKYAYYNHSGTIHSYSGFWRFFLGSIYCGLGNSLGREGPTVHFCSAISSRLGRWMFRDRLRIQSALPVGMAAGIAAAFNAPLSAITFVFEELLDNFSMKALGGIVVAVVIAAAVSRTMLGEDPILDSRVINREFATSLWMVVGIPMGVIAGLLGHGFVSSILGLRGALKNRLNKTRWLVPTFGGVSCGLIAVFALEITTGMGDPQNSVFSIGYQSLEMAFEDKLIWQILFVLLICKFIAVVVNYATGGSGGLFSPTLFLGGMLGGLVGFLMVGIHEWIHIPTWPGNHEVIGGCVLLGMGAMFSAVVRCPFTSLIIIFETTRNYSLILPLMVGNMLAWTIAKKLRGVALYDALLVQDNVNLRSFTAYRGSQDFRNLPVAAIMTHDMHTLSASLSAEEALRSEGTKRLKYHSYPILDDEDLLVGIVTRHELEESGSDILLGDVVAGQDVVSVSPDCSIRDAASQMIETNFQQLPIVSAANPRKLLGLLTLNDVARQQNASSL